MKYSMELLQTHYGSENYKSILSIPTCDASAEKEAFCMWCKNCFDSIFGPKLQEMMAPVDMSMSNRWVRVLPLD